MRLPPVLALTLFCACTAAPPTDAPPDPASPSTEPSSLAGATPGGPTKPDGPTPSPTTTMCPPAPTPPAPWTRSLENGAVVLTQDPTYCGVESQSRGHCEGDVLAYCHFGMKYQVHCPMYGMGCRGGSFPACDTMASDYVPPDPADECARVGGRGECLDGTHLRYCSDGLVIEVDCSTIPGTVCRYSNNSWGCADPRNGF